MDKKILTYFIIGLVVISLSFGIGYWIGDKHTTIKPTYSKGKPEVTTSVDSGRSNIIPVVRKHKTNQDYTDSLDEKVLLGLIKAEIDTTLYIKEDSIKIKTDKPYYFEKEFIEKGLELFYWITHIDTSRVDTVFVPTQLNGVTEKSFWDENKFTFGYISGILTFGGIAYLVLKVVGVFK